MCLSKIKKWHRKDSGIGYKVFLKDVRTRKITSPFAGTFITINKWKTAKPNCELRGCKAYNRGFHIFKHKKDALSYSKYQVYTYWSDTKIIRKVKYKKVICSGYQGRRKKTIVADYMLVLPDKKRK